MKTMGLVHRIDANASIRSDVLEADSDQLVLDAFRAVFGPILTSDDLISGNRLPDAAGDPHTLVREMTWGHWQSLNPVTVLGAQVLDRGTGSAPVSVLAGPDSGFTIGLDTRTPLLSRVAQPGAMTIIDPCMSRQPSLLELDPAREQSHSCLGTTIFAPSPRTWADAPRTTAEDRRAPARPLAVAPMTRSPPLQQTRDQIHVAPDPVEDPRPAKPPQWWTFLIPIGIGVVLAVVTSMWWFLLFSVSAPISGYVAYVMERRRFARDSRRCTEQRRAAADNARTRLYTIVSAHRKEDVRSDSGLCLGFGSVLSHITIADDLCEGIDHLGDRVIIGKVPICVDPLTTSVSVTGDYEQLRNMALSWLSERTYNWVPCPELLRLPEFQGTRFALGAEAVESSAAPQPPNSAPSLPSRHREAQVGLRLHINGSTSALHLDAPAASSAISLELGSLAQARTSASSAPHGPVPGRSFIAALMPPGRFLTLERCNTTETGVERWPSHGLGDVYDDAPEAIRRRWAHYRSVPVLIGRGISGDVGIDLFSDGPHALVAGTTGSGKSILLQTWLLAMALQHPPERLRFVLIDFKGGATFAPLQSLPHTDSVLDDFDSAAAFRALVSIRAEITRRERLLAEHGSPDVLGLANPPPRLVVVIDEFHALMATHPKAADLLEHLTALGRSLGVHLILATQRPLGVVTGHMKANINIRMCLRVRDDADSFDVLGVEDAAHLPPDKPGSAVLDSGSAISRFRVAVPIADSSSAEVVHRPRLRPWSPGQGLPTQGGIRGIRVENILAAAHEDHGEIEGTSSPTPPVVLPPLPSNAEFGDGTNPSLTGILDIPSHQRQTGWAYSPMLDGSALVLGPDQEIVTSTLERMAAGAAQTHRIVALGRIASVLSWAEITCGMDTGWRLQSILDHLNRPHTAGAETLVVCSNWNELVDSLDHHWADTVERLLKHASGLGLTFLVAGCRPTTTVTAGFSTQVIFPPSAGGDGLSVGLSRQRFVGTWPEGRAVLIGPSAGESGSEGADIQLVIRPHGSAMVEGGTDCPEFEPRWHGLDNAHQPGDVEYTDTSIPLGLDPFGELVDWDPSRDGSVLSVRGSPQSGKTDLGATLRAGCGQSPQSRLGRSLIVHDDAHLDTDPASFDPLDGRIHVVTMPVRFTPGYGSPLAKASGMGPVLVLGTHNRQDLSNLGLLRLAPLDGEPGVAWFVTEQRARPVRLFSSQSLTLGRLECLRANPQEVP